MSEDNKVRELCARLNEEVRTALKGRRTSFFFPELNGPEDPYGLKAFHEGDLDVTDGHLDMTTRQRSRR
ncbi:hypothetical protein ACFL0Y_04560 [Patescibacteria group bacterium]